MMDWKIYFEDELNRFKKNLRKLGYKDTIDQFERKIVFAPFNSVLYRSEKIQLKKSDLIDYDSFLEDTFKTLCNEERDWIRFGLFGLANDLLVIDFIAGSPVGNPKPNLIFSGAPGQKVELIS